MKKIGLLVLVMLGYAQSSNAAEEYAKISANELNEALIVAVKKGSADEVQKLVRAGANGNQKIIYTSSDYYDFDPVITCSLLEYAATHGYVDIVREFINAKSKKDDVNKALVLAAKKGHANVVKELVRAKPTVEVINTALLSAASNFPNFSSSGRGGRTVLKDYLNAIKELIKAGANVNYADKYGNTALIEIIEHSLYTDAQKKDRAEIIQALVKAKANVNHANKIGDGDTALIRAVRNHDFDGVQLLLKVPRININHANNKGNTALIVAIQSIRYTYVAGNNEEYNNCLNSQKILEKLLHTPGINLHHVNKNGDTAIKLLKKLEEEVNSRKGFFR